MPTPSRLASKTARSTIPLLVLRKSTSKLVASLEAGNPPDITRLDAWLSSLYRSQGHLLEVTDMVEKMQRQARRALSGLR